MVIMVGRLRLYNSLPGTLQNEAIDQTRLGLRESLGRSKRRERKHPEPVEGTSACSGEKVTDSKTVQKGWAGFNSTFLPFFALLRKFLKFSN